MEDQTQGRARARGRHMRGADTGATLEPPLIEMALLWMVTPRVLYWVTIGITVFKCFPKLGHGVSWYTCL